MLNYIKTIAVAVSSEHYKQVVIKNKEQISLTDFCPI